MQTRKYQSEASSIRNTEQDFVVCNVMDYDDTGVGKEEEDKNRMKTV